MTILRRSARSLLAAGVFVVASMVGHGEAIAQVCVTNQQQLTQAIGDSQSALERVTGTLDGFARDLIGPRTAPIDATTVVSARSNLDAFIGALSEFSDQVDEIGQSCGAEFAADARTLSALVGRFGEERARADQLLSDHQALVDSGEPAMGQEEMEAVQRALREQGVYEGGIDGRFGAGTREAIGRYQQARGAEGTGYLTPAQRDDLLQAGTTAVTEAQQPDVDELPVAPGPGEAGGSPDGDDLAVSGTPGPEAADTEAARICLQNTAEVDNAIERTRAFADQTGPRIADFRGTIRGPREPAIDGDAGSRIIDDVNGYLSALEAFYDQAESVVGHCGSAFDDRFETLSRQVESLRAINRRVVDLNDEYAALVASGEPAMSEETMQQVQTGLKALGHYGGAIDALFGTGTRRAIRLYQESVGAEASGYLSAEQVAALEAAAVAPPLALPESVDAPPGDDATDSPEAATPSVDLPPAPGSEAGDARRLIERDLAQRQAPAPFSDVGPGDGRFGDHWWQARDNVTGGRPQVAVDQRLALFGAAYLDRGTESLSLVDAHLIVGDAFARLGLFGDAAFHFQRAFDLWSALDRGEGAERALVLERLVAARLAQAVAAGRFDADTFDALHRMLSDALAAVDAADSPPSGLRDTILDRLADLYAAADRQPESADIVRAYEARYSD